MVDITGGDDHQVSRLGSTHVEWWLNWFNGQLAALCLCGILQVLVVVGELGWIRCGRWCFSDLGLLWLNKAPVLVVWI